MAKVKHWHGYGSLDVKKLAEYPFGAHKKKVVLLVSGLHECGVILKDKYDIWTWLSKRFFPDCADHREIRTMEIVPMNVKDADGKDVDGAVYELEYWTK